MIELKIEGSIKKINELQGKKGAYRNVADQYLPIGPQTEKEQNLNWDIVYKSIVENIFHLTCKNRDWDELRAQLVDKIRNNRETKDLIDILQQTYLEKEGFKKSTPFYYLVCNGKAQARTKTMVAIFDRLFYFSEKNTPITKGNNFLETLVNENFVSLCDEIVKDKSQYPYLPFLAKLFHNDINTLLKNSDYFLDELHNFVELYSFLYLTQLTVNLVTPDSRYKEPESRKLYFILENEKASQERHDCRTYGFNYLFSKNTGLAWKLFPYLGYLDLITDVPIWRIEPQQNEAFIGKINELNKLIAQLFEIPTIHFNDIKAAINHGLTTQIEIFKKSERSSANEKVVNVFKDVFCRNFKTDRKKAGMHFVLKTNMVLLVTNLIIGTHQKMLIDEVIEGFQQRGIWFDIKSKGALLKLYENIGNIEKLSDSGDAVYVKSTI